MSSSDTMDSKEREREVICTRDATEHTCQPVEEGLLVFIWVCHCWSVHADNCAKLFLRRGSLIVMILSLTDRGISVSFVTKSFLIAKSILIR